MGKKDRCCVGSCDNDKRYTNKVIKRSHVKELKWHRFTQDPIKRKEWIKLIGVGRKDFEPGLWTYVCSNQFEDGMPTLQNPNPTLYLNPSSIKEKSPVKRRKISRTLPVVKANVIKELGEDIPFDEVSPNETHMGRSSLTFDQVTRDCDVRFYTGFISTEIFKILFEHFKFKASTMIYWDGNKKTSKPTRYKDMTFSGIEDTTNIDYSSLDYLKSKPGPSRKLSLETEFFMTLMKLRLGLLQNDLAFRFGISIGKVSQIFITWIKFLSKEMGVLIIWPSKQQIKNTSQVKEL